MGEQCEEKQKQMFPHCPQSKSERIGKAPTYCTCSVSLCLQPAPALGRTKYLEEPQTNLFSNHGFLLEEPLGTVRTRLECLLTTISLHILCKECFFEVLRVRAAMLEWSGLHERSMESLTFKVLGCSTAKSYRMHLWDSGQFSSGPKRHSYATSKSQAALGCC